MHFTDFTDQDIRLLTALITEDTMGLVAKKMGLSSRHARRLIGDLLTRMQATNVRMAVAVAVGCGLVPPPASWTSANPEPSRCSNRETLRRFTEI